MFKLEGDNNTQTFQLYPNATVEWINGKPPVDVPECGFDNKKCIETEDPKLCKLNKSLMKVFKRMHGGREQWSAANIRRSSFFYFPPFHFAHSKINLSTEKFLDLCAWKNNP